MIPDPVKHWLEVQGFGVIRQARPVGGGCINQGAQIETETGKRFFLKTNTHNPADMFAQERRGLEVLKAPGAPYVPQAYLHGPDFLLLEDLDPAAPQRDYWETFGRQLAALHKYTHPYFGFDQDNYIGSTPQPNPWVADGYVFFGEHRLLFQARLARQRGLLDHAGLQDVKTLVARLPGLIPEQPASLIHGDLWSGNAITNSEGQPALIDPAVHYGWAEAELAMTGLFGAFPDTFYRAYQQENPLAPGYEDRFPLYNLYHLLNHLNLFGLGYRSQVNRILQRFR